MRFTLRRLLFPSLEARRSYGWRRGRFGGERVVSDPYTVKRGEALGWRIPPQ
jgi:hypothetical protein